MAQIRRVVWVSTPTTYSGFDHEKLSHQQKFRNVTDAAKPERRYMDEASSKNSKVMKIIEVGETKNSRDDRQTRKRKPKSHRDGKKEMGQHRFSACCNTNSFMCYDQSNISLNPSVLALG